MITAVSTQPNISLELADFQVVTANVSLLEHDKLDLDILAMNVNDSINELAQPRKPIVSEWRIVASFIVKWGMMGIIVLCMLGMGATLTWPQISIHVWPPIGMLIGLFGQFCILPLVTVGTAWLFSIESYEAFGCLIMASCPGGTYSTFGTYWTDGQTGLSVVMTACSSIMSFIIMPANLYMYSPLLIEDKTTIEIPYKGIMFGLALAAVPVLIGMMIRCCSKRFAEFVTKITSLIGCIISLIVVVCYVSLFWELYYNASAVLYAIGIGLPLIGFGLAYLLAFMLRQESDVCRTIGIETGCQNTSIATGIILLTFDKDPALVSRVILFPSLYGIFMLLELFLGIAIYQAITYVLIKRSEKIDPDGSGEKQKMFVTVWPSSRRPTVCLPGMLSNNGLLNYNVEAQRQRSIRRSVRVRTGSQKFNNRRSVTD